MAEILKMLISAFPGTGKTYLYENQHRYGKIIKDSDSSFFDKKSFPENYVDHISNTYKQNDMTLISSHLTVREELIKRNITYYLVYPDFTLKNEYMKRYLDRGSPAEFIKLINNNWDNWIRSCSEDPNYSKIILNKGEYLFDVFQFILDTS